MLLFVIFPSLKEEKDLRKCIYSKKFEMIIKYLMYKKKYHCKIINHTEKSKYLLENIIQKLNEEEMNNLINSNKIFYEKLSVSKQMIIHNLTNQKFY